MSQKGPRAYINEAVASVRQSELVKEVARRLGFNNKLVSAMGALSVPSIIVISGLNIVAKKESNKARRELGARGLLVYNDL
jgi:hypothetical protein